MRQIKPSIKPVVGLLAIIAVGLVLYLSIEFYDEKQKSTWSAEALSNPYLAAHRFLERSEIKVIDADNLLSLETLSENSTLFISDSNRVVRAEQLEQLKSWIERGGNLIYAANSTSHDEDLLLENFNLTVEWRDDDDELEFDRRSMGEILRDYNRQIREGKKPDEINQSFTQETLPMRVKFDDAIDSLEVAFKQDRVLSHPSMFEADETSEGPQPTGWSNSAHGVHLLQFDLGEGLLTFVSDPSIWTSHRIDEFDHAYLLWLLSNSGDNFVILRPVVQQGLFTQVLANASELLIAILIMIVAWVWHAGHRFGRIMPDRRMGARAITEHFSTISLYLWQRRHRDYLIEPLRQKVLRRASMTLSGYDEADDSLRYQLIAKHIGLEPAMVISAMATTDFNESTFVHAVKLLKRIEQSL